MSEYICEITEYRSSWGESFTWATEYKEPIVRCCDCKFYKHGDRSYWCSRLISVETIHPNSFCAWGERINE